MDATDIAIDSPTIPPRSARPRSVNYVLGRIRNARDFVEVYYFFRSRGSTPKHAELLTGICADLLHPRTRDWAIFEEFVDLLKDLHDDIIKLFCLVNPSVSHVLLSHAVIHDIILGSVDGQSPKDPTGKKPVFNAKIIAHKIRPVLVEIEGAPMNLNGVVVQCGKYESFAFAAILLGAYGAPVAVLEDLIEFAHDQALAPLAINAFRASECASEALLLEYEACAIIAPMRPRAIVARSPPSEETQRTQKRAQPSCATRIEQISQLRKSSPSSAWRSVLLSPASSRDESL